MAVREETERDRPEEPSSLRVGGRLVVLLWMGTELESGIDSEVDPAANVGTEGSGLFGAVL